MPNRKNFRISPAFLRGRSPSAALLPAAFAAVRQNPGNAEENVLNEAGKIDYHTLKPVLFEMPTYEYLRTGDVIGKCMNLSK